MILQKCIQKDEPYPLPQVGELRLLEGKKSMCVCREAHYGGGSGPLWATEGVEAYATFRDYKYPGYLKVVCEKVYPLDHAVLLRVLDGPTWGTISIGRAVRIHASKIGRYNERQASDRDWAQETAQQDLRLQSQNAFANATKAELKTALEHAYANALGDLIGHEQARRCQEIFRQYDDLLEVVGKSGGWFARHPTKEAKKIAKQIQALLDPSHQGGETPPTTSSTPQTPFSSRVGRS